MVKIKSGTDQAYVYMFRAGLKAVHVYGDMLNNRYVYRTYPCTCVFISRNVDKKSLKQITVCINFLTSTLINTSIGKCGVQVKVITCLDGHLK